MATKKAPDKELEPVAPAPVPPSHALETIPSAHARIAELARRAEKDNK